MDQICQTCHHYQPLPAGPKDFRPKVGVCTHPDHASVEVVVLIKPLEMRCRRGFGLDDWAPAVETPTDRVIGEKTSDPDRRRTMAPRFMLIPTYTLLHDAVAD